MRGSWKSTIFGHVKDLISTYEGNLGTPESTRSELIVRPVGYRRYVRIVTVRRLPKKINSEQK
jgi:hypothetical protein